MEKVLNQLVERLKKAYGDTLISVVLYGSAASGDHQAKFSDLNVLCVLADITPLQLGAAEHLFQWWRGLGNPSPLLFAESELARSAASFAIEFRDIQRSHRILFGKDVIAPLVLDRSSYRDQVEHDLRAKLLRLRQKAAGAFSDPDLLRRMLADSVSTFCVLFRHALALHGAEEPLIKREVIERARLQFAIDSQPFETLLDIREQRIRARDVEPVRLLRPYLAGISSVLDAVGRLGK